MTAYISHRQLAENPGARELAQVATARHEPVVDYALMEATLRGEDRSAWSAEEIARADAALDRIDQEVANAGALIDGYLSMRNLLPLEECQGKIPGVVTNWARAIARYGLHKDRITDERSDPIVRDYRDALKLLQQVADGKFSLGPCDDTATGGAGEPSWSSPSRIFTRGTLEDF